MNLAIVIGVEKYKSSDFKDLSACKNDAETMRDVLDDVKNFTEILYINEEQSAQEVKDLIIDFVDKHAGNEVKELVFYFSGHGERYPDDFFYILSDFDRNRRQSTGLKNSELDGLLKKLSPKLCVKIVDACFSGTQYIKSESDTEVEFQKSADKYELKDLYFWFSSRENESSLAGKGFSHFTESILLALTERNDEVRYRDIMAHVADDFDGKDVPAPIFISQMGNTEVFGNVTNATHNIIWDAFGLEVLEEGDTQKETKQTEEPPCLSVKILNKARETSFSEALVDDFLVKLYNNLSQWQHDITDNLYTVSVLEVDSTWHIPNSKRIGFWLNENKNAGYFAQADFEDESYQEEEYKALPHKPNAYQSNIVTLAAQLGGVDHTQYKLETVTKYKKVISGFNYTHRTEKQMLKVDFEPNNELTQPVSLFVLSIYSNQRHVIHYSYERLSKSNWSSRSGAACKEWKTLDVNINRKDAAQSACEHIQNEVLAWLEKYLEGLLA